MIGPLRDQVLSRLPWLVDDLGFRIGDSAYDYKGRGASYVELASDSVRLRFTRGVSPISLHVASPAHPDQWFELGALWVALHSKRPDPELEGWAWFFREHLDEIARAVGPEFEQTKDAYAEWKNQVAATVRRYRPRLTLVGRLRSVPWGGEFLVGPLGWIVAGVLLLWKL
jgi:hypothetical protein